MKLNYKKIEFFHQGKKLILYYNDNNFKITSDNLALTNFINLNSNDKTLIEFGSGLLVIPLLLSTYTNIKMFGIEKNEQACFLSNMSINVNKLKNIITVINDDIKNISNYFDINSVDIVVCNPPYFDDRNNFIINNNISLSMARHEISMSFLDVVKQSKKILKNNGKLFLIHRVDRFFEIVDILRNNNFAIKKVQFVYHNKFSNSKLVLIEARKNGKEQGLKVIEPLFLEEGELCE